MEEKRNQKVLLADDGPIVIKFLNTVLKKNEYDIAVAKDGMETIEMTKSYLHESLFGNFYNKGLVCFLRGKIAYREKGVRDDLATQDLVCG